jgi:hypothetical protein
MATEDAEAAPLAVRIARALVGRPMTAQALAVELEERVAYVVASWPTCSAPASPGGPSTRAGGSY